ncbi:hypothetical protein B7C51_04555 [Paenibacillus larvae subsp. pulvifaciens]|uniref:rRNA biogenesis protein rrp5 n=1 Tax=Paenibacillus larvae subsp. pulvifaciens TaxID=1477 RepID=A0A1V0UPM7_9BACL|nr:hypothetical protein [Paenibacillus larvae]ARF67245.1 hypothetical protein B7C51_04555 [Paenibacillus larvae subsp. pulvifaciens]
MAIEIKINADNAVELKRDLGALLSLVDGTPAKTPAAVETTKATEEKPKRQKKQVAKQEETKQEEAKEPVAPSDVINIDDLISKARGISDQSPEARKAVKALIRKFGVTNISTIPEEKRAEFLAELEAL